MKVLFAVSSESISEAIIKRYQKEYKEILSYKNVYYFNAILKEIQKDKTYDRIIISEDLEPFSNNNYDTIDKFIFEKLDSISDEAQDSTGKETSIILICTDRRVKGNSILVKLFGIGVYNALLGNDRSMDEVCKLINRPRTKKEAKIYYRIDTDEVNYKAENENEVSEVEIQNILAHFKKLGRNTAKYADSFNNIAIQYTDEQLKIIINCLPINIKAVLETNCERYQQLMSATGGIPSVKGMVSSSIEGTIKNEVSERKIGQAGKITKPIVIPSAVRSANNVARPVVKKSPTAIPEQIEPQQKPAQRPVVRPVQKVATVKQSKPVEEDLLSDFEDKENDLIPSAPQKKNSMEAINFEELEENPANVVTKKVVTKSVQLPEVENDDLGLDIEETSAKRGRGRPRKTPVSGVEVKQKGKRGRPRKIVEEFEESSDVEEPMLPGIEDDFEDSMLPGVVDGYEENYEESDSMLPGIEDSEAEFEDDMLPGMEDEEYIEEEEFEEPMLPGVEEDLVEEEVLEEDSEEYEEIYENELPEEEFYEEELPEDDIYEEVLEEELPEEIVEEEYVNEELLDEEYTEEVSLPGIDDLDDVEEYVEEEYVDEDDSMLLDSDNIEEEVISEEIAFHDGEEDSLLPGFSETEEEETLLPGMGFSDENDLDDMSGLSQNYQSNSLESIKPRVDYSMSSLNSLITKDKKIVTFIGTSKNGTSFLVNNLAALFSSLGINTAILDMTQNKNSYYIYTKNEEELRTIAFNSIEKLQNGYAEGIKVDKNLTVYTALPNDGKDYSNAEPILSTLVQNHSLILIDCDYETDLSYFASCQEMYLVQSMDILTIQPLTAFLRELKTRGILEPEKIRVVINKELKVRSLSIKAIIGGLSYYNDPAMSFMTELFNKDIVKACTIPFDNNAYSKYLEGIVNCSISFNGYSRQFESKFRILGDMVYPLTSKQSYNRTSVDYNRNAFSNSMNDTLNKMRKKY